MIENSRRTPQKMKLCVAVTTSYAFFTFLKDQLLYLVDNGFDVTVVCNNDKEMVEHCPQSITYISIPMNRSISFFSTIVSFLYLLRYLMKNRFDMIQYTSPKASLIAAIAGWAVRIRVRLYCQWGLRYVGEKGIKRLLLKFFEKLTCILSTHISPDSKGNLEYAFSEGLYPKEKASVVYFGSANGVNMSKFDVRQKANWRHEVRTQLGLNADDLVIGWVGRLTRDKGIRELIGAFQIIKEKIMNANLLMIGTIERDHNLPSEVLSIIDTDARIHYVGARSDIEKYYAAMDLLVLPSYREGFGVPAIEGQAMGIPIIATDIPGPREALVDGVTGLLVPVADVDALASAISLLLNDQQRRLEMGEKGYRYANKCFEQQAFWEKVLQHRRHLLGLE